MFRHLTHRRVTVAAATLALAIAGAVAIPTAASAATYTTYGASAYGSTVALGSTYRSGETALVPMCTTHPGYARSVHTAAVNLPDTGATLIHIGAVTTNVHSSTSGGTVKSHSDTSTAGADITGLLGATVITSSATETRTGSTYTPTGRVTFAGLTVAGLSLPTNFSPTQDQKFTLAGVGTLLFNHRSLSTSFGAHKLTVTALRIDLTVGNLLGLPTGTIVIGNSSAALHTPTHHLPYGSASGTLLQVGSTVRSGPTAPVYLPCGGTSGATHYNTTSSINVPGALQIGAVHTYARSTDSATATAAYTRSTIASAILLGGIVPLSAITTEARAIRKPHGPMFFSSAGTTIGKLKINGHYQSGAVPSNTKVTIPGVGTLYLHRVLRSSTGVHVIALELVLSQAVSGQKKGTVLIVGSARAGVYSR